MALNPGTSFRRAGFALATIAGLAAGDGANAQTGLKATPANAPFTQTVSKGDCDAFGSYLLDEARQFKDAMSKTFLQTSVRFLRAGCAATDKDGEIQLITMTDQDAASLRTALRLMGKVDIIGLSGVKGCARPATGICPANTSANTPKVGGG